MVAWAQRRGLASLSVYQVSLLVRRLQKKFELFATPFQDQQAGGNWNGGTVMLVPSGR